MRLKQTLLNLTKAELSELRSLYELKNISQLNKAELVEQMAALLPQRYPLMLERLGQTAHDTLYEMASGVSLAVSPDIYEFGLEALQQHGLIFLCPSWNCSTRLSLPVRLDRKWNACPTDSAI